MVEIHPSTDRQSEWLQKTPDPAMYRLLQTPLEAHRRRKTKSEGREQEMPGPHHCKGSGAGSVDLRQSRLGARGATRDRGASTVVRGRFSENTWRPCTCVQLTAEHQRTWAGTGRTAVRSRWRHCCSCRLTHPATGTGGPAGRARTERNPATPPGLVDISRDSPFNNSRTLLKSQGTATKTDHMLVCRTLLTELERIETIQSILSDHSGIAREVSDRKIRGKPSDTWDIKQLTSK